MEDSVNLLFMIRSLERIGDIARTIAATAVFLKEATDIRHGKLPVRRFPVARTKIMINSMIRIS